MTGRAQAIVGKRGENRKEFVRERISRNKLKEIIRHPVWLEGNEINVPVWLMEISSSVRITPCS